MFAATNMKDPFPAFVVAFGIWALFFWGWRRRLKKAADRQALERQFRDYMRGKSRNIRQF